MVNVFLEIERLRSTLRNKGLDERTIDEIAKKAEQEIEAALGDLTRSSIELGVQSGVQKDSADFINELRPRQGSFTLETSSGKTDFSDPPYPMLDSLLKGAKPLADGSGVYKIIPVGKKGNKKPIATNIFDAQKAIAAERYTESVARYKTIAPKDSKVQFRTATSKQNRDTQWVRPATEKDFTEDLRNINDMMETTAKDAVMSIIRGWEEEF